MSTIKKVEKVPFKTPKEGYLKALTILPELGFEIWKTREIGNLILAQKTKDTHGIKCNIMFNYNGTVNIALDSETEDEKTLAGLADEILAALVA